MSDLTPRAALREALDFIDQHSTPVPNVLVRARWEAALDAHQCLPSEEELAAALQCEDDEEPCDADGRDEHRWCDQCIARHVLANLRERRG